jgi:hypothetical protein
MDKWAWLSHYMLLSSLMHPFHCATTFMIGARGIHGDILWKDDDETKWVTSCIQNCDSELSKDDISPA